MFYSSGEMLNRSSLTPPPPLSPGSLPPPRQLPSPLLAMSRYLSQAECLTDEEDLPDNDPHSEVPKECHVSKTSGSQEFHQETNGYQTNNLGREDHRDSTLLSNVFDRRPLKGEASCCRNIADDKENNPGHANKTFSRTHGRDSLNARVKFPQLQKDGSASSDKFESDDNEDIVVLENDRCVTPATLSMLPRKRQLVFDQSSKKSPVVNVAWSGNLHQRHRNFESPTAPSVPFSAKMLCSKTSNIRGRKTFSPLECLKSQFETRTSRGSESGRESPDTPIGSTSGDLPFSPETTLLGVKSVKYHKTYNEFEEGSNNLVTFVTTRLAKRLVVRFIFSRQFISVSSSKL